MYLGGRAVTVAMDPNFPLAPLLREFHFHLILFLFKGVLIKASKYFSLKRQYHNLYSADCSNKLFYIPCSQAFHPQFSKSHVPLIDNLRKLQWNHPQAFVSCFCSFLCSCACVHEGLHGFVHVHMNIMIVTHASLQPFVMSLFYSESFYDVQIVWGFGDHQHNWQRHNECFSIFSTPGASLQLWKGLDALKLYVLAENVLYFSHKVYKGKFSIRN